jgi:hypothetical protein
MTDSADELMKSYEVIRSIVMQHSQYDAAMMLTLNLATCITAGSKEQDEAQPMARFADSICTLRDAVRDMKEDPQTIEWLLKKGREKLN